MHASRRAMWGQTGSPEERGPCFCSRTAVVVLALLAATPVTGAGQTSAVHEARSGARPARGPAGQALQAAARSAWIPAPGRGYRLTHRYGSAEDDWLEGVAGVEVDPRTGDVFVYDAARASVVALTPELSFRFRFGGRGQGPGELAPMFWFRHPPPPRPFISVGADTLSVYDGGFAVHEFTTRGAFVGYREGFPRGAVPHFRLVGIHRHATGLLYAVDTWGWGAGERALETWLAAGGDRELLFSLPLEPLPSRMMGADEARPQWAVGDRAVYVGDGEGDLVVAYRLDSGALDTLRLPGIEREGERHAASDYPDLPGPGSRPTPAVAARWRWTRMIVDPDGWIWIEPRNVAGPDEARGVTAVVLNPETGAHQRTTVPAMPRAFGRPGVFYEAMVTEALEVHQVLRYEMR